jgi:hypothetical protein
VQLAQLVVLGQHVITACIGCSERFGHALHLLRPDGEVVLQRDGGRFEQGALRHNFGVAGSRTSASVALTMMTFSLFSVLTSLDFVARPSSSFIHAFLAPINAVCPLTMSKDKLVRFRASLG